MLEKKDGIAPGHKEVGKKENWRKKKKAMGWEDNPLTCQSVLLIEKWVCHIGSPDRPVTKPEKGPCHVPADSTAREIALLFGTHRFAAAGGRDAIDTKSDKERAIQTMGKCGAI